MNVLCVNHTGSISGGERSLLDLLSGLREDVNVRLACPPTGPLAAAARRLGVPVDEIPGTDGSLRLHPRETPIAVGRMSVAAVRTAGYAKRMRADVIHANSIRAGLLTVPAARMASTPAVVHLRDRLPRSTVADASLRLIAGGAQIDHSLDAELAQQGQPGMRHDALAIGGDFQALRPPGKVHF